MKSFAIYVGATSDLPMDLVEKHHFHTLPMSFTLGNKEYYHDLDYPHLSNKDFYDLLRKGETSTTSQVTVNTFMEAWEKTLQSGQDILYVGFSGALSGTAQSGFLAQKMLSEKYPQRKILCIDTLSASAGEGLLALHAAALRDDGKTIEEVFQWLENHIHHMIHLFTVDDLNHLKRGGRISSAAALLGSAIGIKPLLTVNDEGKLVPNGKARGRKKALKELVDQTVNLYDPFDQTIVIVHGDCHEDALLLGSMLSDALPIKEIVYSTIGPIIGSHGGPGTLLIGFLGKNRLNA